MGESRDTGARDAADTGCSDSEGAGGDAACEGAGPVDAAADAGAHQGDADAQVDDGADAAAEADGGADAADDACPDDPDKTTPGVCGCGVPDRDTDGDATPDCMDDCPDDANKTLAGTCGCGVPDDDSDADGTVDCDDACPDDPDKVEEQACGCGVAELDSDGDATPDCLDECPDDADKTLAGACGCGTAETDRDGDGVADCMDGCADDPDKLEPGPCGCGTADCGCTCVDPEWSCSQDTCHDDNGDALGLLPEAGFFEIAGGSYVSEGVERVAPTQRVWYAFRPADEQPEDKPLAIFFNGGPGSATLYLYAFNTGFYTLDPERVDETGLARNPYSWTRFVNALHVDAPGTGFSYSLPNADGETPSVGIDMDRDAGTFLRVLLRFLGRHPSLTDNTVMIVGESYGGTRATLMLKHALFFGRLIDGVSPYQDQELYDELAGHFTRIFPGAPLQDLGPADIATQFAYQVLIQPVVAGSSQWDAQDFDTSVCAASYDSYQCDAPSGWSDQLGDAAMQHLATPDDLATVLGVDPTTIAFLHASERTEAYGHSGSGYAADDSALVPIFGALGAEDNYYVKLNTTVLGGYPGARSWMDPAVGVDFIYNAYYVHTFITNARYDMVVDTTAIVPGVRSYASLIADATHDTAARAGVDRPGWIALSYDATSFEAPLEREIRFPYYPEGGHAVSMRSPAELLDDVSAWYAAQTDPLVDPGMQSPPVLFSIAEEPASTRSPVAAPAVPAYLGP